MIRSAMPEDTPAILDLVVAAEMFAPGKTDPVASALEGFHAGSLGEGHQVSVWASQAGLPEGAVYFAPDEMAERKWDLWMIVVAPDRQRQGIGGELLAFVENAVKAQDGRMLLIETSSTPKYAGARAFYERHGFVEAARIPDFYKDGDSKVIFAKRTATATQ